MRDCDLEVTTGRGAGSQKGRIEFVRQVFGPEADLRPFKEPVLRCERHTEVEYSETLGLGGDNAAACNARAFSIGVFHGFKAYIRPL